MVAALHAWQHTDLDAAVVNEHIVHFEESILCPLVRVKADECVAQRVPRLVVPEDVARGDFAKAREYDLKILHGSGPIMMMPGARTGENHHLMGGPGLYSNAHTPCTASAGLHAWTCMAWKASPCTADLFSRDRVELADKEHVRRRPRISLRQVPNHLQDDSSAVRLQLATLVSTLLGPSLILLWLPIIFQPVTLRAQSCSSLSVLPAAGGGVLLKSLQVQHLAGDLLPNSRAKRQCIAR